jgi:hypothetical protein
MIFSFADLFERLILDFAILFMLFVLGSVFYNKFFVKKKKNKI